LYEKLGEDAKMGERDALGYTVLGFASVLDEQGLFWL
jgi:hypothetical protein